MVSKFWGRGMVSLIYGDKMPTGIGRFHFSWIISFSLKVQENNSVFCKTMISKNFFLQNLHHLSRKDYSTKITFYFAYQHFTCVIQLKPFRDHSFSTYVKFSGKLPMPNVPKLSDTIKKVLQQIMQYFKVCLTILEFFALKV